MNCFTFYQPLVLLSIFILQASTLCEDGDLRLVGSFLLEGRVEVCSMGEWGLVCDNYWDNQDAMVVCRELGFSDKGSLALTGDYVSRNIGSGTGPIVLRKAECSGKEARLKDCPNSYALCYSPYSAGVRCRRKGNPVLAFNQQIYPNNSIIDLESISALQGVQNGIACITDQYPCCDSKDGWYAPNNTNMIHHSNFFVATYPQSVILHRQEDKYVPNGIFHCEMKDSSGDTHSLYIGVYLQGLGKPTITSIKFDWHTKTIICSSIGGPTTTVSWSKDGNKLNGTGYEQSQHIIDTGLAVYENNLMVPLSEKNLSGLYSCTVSNLRGSSTAALFLKACGDGDVLFDTDTEEISQICYNGNYYHVVATQSTENKIKSIKTNRTFQSTSDGGKDRKMMISFGGLFGISLLVNVVTISVCLSLLLLHKKHNHILPSPSNRSQPEELHDVEHKVENEIYGMKGDELGNSDSDSMTYNLAYMPSSRNSQNAGGNHYEVTTVTNTDVIYEIPNSDC